jgi:hypothetical protein
MSAAKRTKSDSVMIPTTQVAVADGQAAELLRQHHARGVDERGRRSDRDGVLRHHVPGGRRPRHLQRHRAQEIAVREEPHELLVAYHGEVPDAAEAKDLLREGQIVGLLERDELAGS